MKSKKITFTYVILTIISLCFLGCGVFFLSKGFDNKETIFLTYDTSKSDVKYKVYLKPNDFFDEPYLEENKTYITNLIDYINVDYNYNIEFDKEVSGTYEYYIMATIEASKPNGEDGVYWTKDYPLSDKQTIEINNASNYLISNSIKVDYNKFNGILNDFKTAMGLSLDGKLSVYLKVTNNLTNNSMDLKPINSSLGFNIPLSSLAVEANIDKDNNNTNKKIETVVKKHDAKYLLFKAVGVLFILISIYVIACMYRIKKEVEHRHKFEITKKKILSTYDSIIVNVKNNPDLDGLSVIKTESFDELIDAHSEIRMPINYYENERTGVCYFTLISDTNAWQYILKSDGK